MSKPCIALAAVAIEGFGHVALAADAPIAAQAPQSAPDNSARNARDQEGSGLTGALVGLGIPEYEAKQYEGKIRGGNMPISVHTDDGTETTRAKDIFKRDGAEDISWTSEASV